MQGESQELGASGKAASVRGGLMNCSRCKTARLVEIRVNLGERQVTMHSCSRCDSRWWDSEGENMALPSVVELATTRR